MIRTLITLCATLTICLTLTGCNGGGGDGADAPKGGKRRPVPEEPKSAPGPDMSGGDIKQGESEGGAGGGG